MTTHLKLACLAAAIFSFSAAIPVSAATISLDGTWQSEAVPEARGEAIPTAFTRTIPVLKTLAVKTAGDAMSRRFGMRTFDANPATRRFRLNGRDRMLFGTNTDLFRFYDDPQCVTVKVDDIAPNGVAAIDEIEIH